MIPVNALAADETDNDGITSGKTYVITSKNSGKAMEVANLGINNGDKIQQWDYANSTSQQWIIKQVEGQYYEIISKKTGKVVDVKDLSTQNGAVIHQWDFVNGDNQLWYFEKTDDGYFKIKSKQSNKCIDISGISKDNGAKIQIWDDVNGDNQKWKVEKIKEENYGDPLNLQIDPDKDYDGDGIINSLEDEFGTNMFLVDSDKDGLSDYDEIYTYKTNPLLEDTDGDTINDYCEIKLGLDPLTKNNVENQYSYIVDNNELGVNVNVKGSAIAVSTTRVEKVEDDFLSSIPNTLGNIIEFSSKSSIDGADVTIKYDEDELKSKGINEDNLSIYYINETDLKLEKVNTIIDKDNKTLTCELKHFSKYLVGDSSKIVSDLSSFDIIFAIDKSGSMDWNDSESKRIDVCEKLVNDDSLKNSNYRFGIVSFDSNATPTKFEIPETTYLTNDHSSVIAGLEKLKGIASGGTNFADAINEATDMFNDKKRKVIILLTDGDQTSGNVNYAVNNAKNNDVQIYTVGLGNDVNVSVLRDKIANATGGKYFHADDADSLYQCFDDLSKNISNGKEEEIYLGNQKCDKVKLIGDSGFDSEKDGYSFINYQYKDNDGSCFGMSVTSILYYLNKLPFDSSKSHLLASIWSDEYNVTNIDTIKSGKRLNDIKFEYDNFSIDCKKEYKSVKNFKLSELNSNEQEIIKMNNWWNNIQTDTLLDSLRTLSTWSASDVSSIDNIINVLNERPIQLFYMGFSGGKFCSHALVAENLYKSTTQEDVYYLKVYNPNTPNEKDYIKVTEGIDPTKDPSSNPRVTLSFEDSSEDYDDIYMATNPVELLDKAF